MPAAFLMILIFFTGLACEQKLSDDIEIHCAHEHLGAGADLGTLLLAMDATGIKKMILLGSYESLLKKQKKKDFSTAHSNNLLILDAAKRHPDRFLPFVLIDTKMENPLGMLKDYMARGAKGVKLYNGLRSYRIEPADSPNMLPIYEYCEKNHIPILIHLDVKRYRGELSNICNWFPNLTVIAPHLLCRPESTKTVSKMLERYPNLYTDISYGHESWVVSNFEKISKNIEKLRMLFKKHENRILFGTDVCVSDLAYKDKKYLINQFMGYRKLLEFKHFKFDVIMGANKTKSLELNGLGLKRKALKRIYHGNFNTLFSYLATKNESSKTERPPSSSLQNGLVLDVPSALLDIPESMPGNVQIGSSSALENPDVSFRIVLVLACAFTMPVDDLSRAQLGELLSGKNNNWQDLSGKSRLASLVAPQSLKQVILSGFPELENSQYIRWVDDKSIGTILRKEEGTLALVPLSFLNPRYKVLTIEGTSPFHSLETDTERKPDTYLKDYPLAIQVSLNKPSADPAGEQWVQSLTDSLPKIWFTPGSLKTVLVTGSSLVGQGIAYDKTPPSDPLWPVKKVAPYIRTADIAHISNECPLVENCVQKDDGKWKFCSERHYIDALKHAGFDIVELTGNHQTDAGRKQAAKTYSIYEDAGLLYFGGGKDKSGARNFKVINVRGTRFAFLGYNMISGKKKLAQKKEAGSNSFKLERMVSDIHKARNVADVIFVHFQWGPEFAREPRPRMVKIAHRAITEGATAVHGTHAHRTSALEFFDRGVIFYGLGNFLFAHPGQKWTGRSIVVRYTFLNGKMLNVHPMGVALEDFQLRWLDKTENDELLARLYSHSRPKLEPFPDYPIIAPYVQYRDDKSLNYLKAALNRSGVEEAFVAHGFSKTPEFEQVKNTNNGVFNVKSKSIKFHPMVTIHPEESVSEVDAYENKGAKAFRLLFAPGWKYPDQLLKKITESGKKEGQFVALTAVEDQKYATEHLNKLLSRLSGANVILFDDGRLLSDTKSLGHLLEKYPGLRFGIMAYPDSTLTALAIAADQSPKELAGLIQKHKERFIAGPGLCGNRDLGKGRSQIQGLFFRMMAFRNLLERDRYFFPVLSHRGSEWSYNYEKENERKGLSLTADTLTAIYSGNIQKLMGQGD